MHPSAPASVAARRLSAGVVLAALTIAYCLPGHPHARPGSPADALLHAAVFATLSFLLARTSRRPWTAYAGLALLGIGLELAQQAVGGYGAVEWNDILANLAGIAAAGLARRWRQAAA